MPDPVSLLCRHLLEPYPTAPFHLAMVHKLDHFSAGRAWQPGGRWQGRSLGLKLIDMAEFVLAADAPTCPLAERTDLVVRRLVRIGVEARPKWAYTASVSR